MADERADEGGWQAAAAAITIMFWLDVFVDAAELAAASITRSTDSIATQDYPFDMALLAAEVHVGVPAAPRLAALASDLPGDSVLGGRLAWLADQAGVGPLERLLPNYSTWGAARTPLAGVIGAGHLDDDYADLAPGRKRALWNALRTTDQAELAWDLMERTKELPPQWPVCVWLAGWCAKSDRAEDGVQVLMAAHDRWQPYARWDCLPSDIVLQPVLRTLVTDELREHYLTRSIGPEARKK
jgi:hypothetical protein